MSRTRFSLRTQLEALESRLAPGSLLGSLEAPLIDLDSSLTTNEWEIPQSSLLIGAPTSQPAATPPLNIEAAAPSHVAPPLSPTSAPMSSAQAPIQTNSPVVNLINDATVGESTVMRTNEGVIVHLTASGLEPGAYTLWVRVDAPGAGPVSGYLAGHVVGQDGFLQFSARVKTGEVLSGNPHIPSGPLQDPLHAQITLVVRSHGAAEPGRIYEQTHTFEPEGAFNFLRSIHVAPA